jgi:hypothetical protein
VGGPTTSPGGRLGAGKERRPDPVLQWPHLRMRHLPKMPSAGVLQACLFACALLLPTAVLATHAVPPVNLTQRNANGSALATGGTTAEGPEVELTASSDSPTCDSATTYWLEFEVIPATSAFTGAPTHQSPTMVKGSCSVVQYPWAKIFGLVTGTTYKWQVRERLGNGAIGTWVLFNAGNAAFTVGPSPGNQLAFTSSSQTLTVGTCSALTTVQLRDSSNNPMNAASNLAVALSASSTNVQFFSDAGCTTQVTSRTIAAGTSSTSFYWSSTFTGTLFLNADAPAVVWADQAQTLNPGPPSKLVFANTNTSTIIGACSAARNVQTQDVGNNPSPVSSNTLVSLSASSSTTLRFYSDSGCTTEVTQATIAAGQHTVTVYLRDTVHGSRTLTASATGLTNGTQSKSFNYRLVQTTPARTVTAGDCAPIATFQAQDSSGAAYNLPSNLTMNFAWSGSFTFFSDSACGTQITSMVMAAGTNQLSMYWRATVSGSQYFYLYGSFSSNTIVYHTINPGPPVELFFSTPSRTVAAGACSLSVTVRTRDQYGNFSPVSSATAVTLTSTSPQMSYFSNSTCGTSISGVTIANNSSTATFYFRDNRPGTPSITASATGLNQAVQSHTVQPLLAFASPAQTLVAGTCSALTTVQTRDGTGAAWNGASNVTVNLSTSSTNGAFFADAGCTTSISAVTIAAGSSTGSFYWQDFRSGTPSLSATATGHVSTAQVQTVNAGPPEHLAFTTSPQAVGAGLCSAITSFQQRDVYGNPATQTTSRTVGLSSTSSGGAFFSNASCTTGISSVNIAAGATGGSFYWSDSTIGSPTLTLASSPLVSGTQTQTVTPGAATRISFTSAAQSLPAGGCSAATTVRTEDAAGNPAVVNVNTVVTLGSTSTAATFFSGAGCTTPVTQVTVPAGGTTATFYWRDTQAGTPTLTASSSGMSSGTQVQTVTATGATQLDFATGEQTVTSNACSDATTVRVLDTYGNMTTVGSALALGLSSSSTGAAFYSDATCDTQVTQVSIPAGGSAQSFYWRDGVPGTPMLTVTATGFPPVSQQQTVGGRDQVRFRWYAADGTTALAAENVVPVIAAGATVHLRLGIAALGFNWQASSGDHAPTSETLANAETVVGTFANLATSDGSVQTLTETKVGQGSTAYRTLGTPTLSGSPNHVYHFGTSIPPGRPSYELCFHGRTSGEALRLGWSATTGVSATPSFPAGWQITSTVIAETCFDLATQGYNGGALSIYLQDAVQNNSDKSNDTFTLDRLYVKGRPPTYVGLERSASPTFSNATQVQTTELWDDTTRNNGGVVPAVLTGTTRPQVFVETRPNVPTAQVDVLAGDQGEWDFALRFPSSGGSHHYRLVITDGAGARLGVVETVTVVARGDTAASQLAFASAPQTRAAGACSAPVTVEARDPSGAVRAVAANTTVNLTHSSSGGAFYSDAGCTTAVTSRVMSAGQSAVTFYWRDTQAGTPTLTAAATGLTPATQQQTVTAAPPTQAVFLTAAQNVVVGECSAVATVQSRDPFGNPSPVSTSVAGPLTSPSGTLQFFSNAGCSTAITSLTLAAGATTASFYFRDTTTGTTSLTWTPSSTLSPASQSAQFSTAVPTALVFSTAPQSLVAGACSAAVTVRSVDQFGNATAVNSATPVSLASTSTGNTFFSNSACTTAITSVTIAAGSSQATFYFRDTTSGGPTLTATAAGLTPATQVQSISAAAPAQLAYTTPAQTLVAGACSAAVTVQVRDTYGNPSPVTSATPVNLTTDSPGGTFHTASGCSGASEVSSVTVAEGTHSVTYYYRDTRAGASQITAAASGLGNVSQVHTIDPGPASAIAFSTPSRTVTAGACSPVLTVQSRDAFANPAAVTSATGVALTATSGTMSFYLDATCTAPVSSVSIAAGSSVTSFYFRDNRSGTPTVTATASLGVANQSHTVNPGAPDSLEFPGTAQTLVAGACAAATAVRVEDAFGNPANVTSSTTVTLGTGSPGGGFFSDAACTAAITTRTIAAGTNSTSFYWRDTQAGTPVLSATATGLQPAGQQQTVDPAPPSKVVFITAPQTLGVGQCSAIATAQAQDPFNNPSPSATARSGGLSSTSSSTQFFSDPGCTAQVSALSLSAGSTTASVYFRDTTAGTATLGWSPTGTPALTPATQAAQFNVAPPDRLVFVTSPQTLVAGSCSAPATVQVRDAYGNPAPLAAAATVALASTSGSLGFFSDAACAQAVSGLPLGAGSTQVTFYFRDTASGDPQLTASTPGLSPANQVATINPGSPAQLAFTAGPASVVAGACSAAFTLQIQDGFGNPSPVTSGTSLQVTGAVSTTVFTGASCASGAGGSPVVGAGGTQVNVWLRDTAAGPLTVNATGAMLTPASRGTVVTAGPAQALALTGFPSSTVAGASHPFTVSAVDAYGNVDPGWTGTVSFSSTDPAATLPGATVFGAQHMGTRMVSATLRTAGTHGLSATDGAAAPITGSQTGIDVVPGPAAALVVAGVPSPLDVAEVASFTVTARDASGNTVTGYAGTVGFGSTDSAATLPAPVTFTSADQGTRTVGGLAFGSPGTHGLTAQDTATAGVSGSQTGIVVRQVQGGVCAQGSDCTSGICSGGVCCATACTGDCFSCAVPGQEGVCAPVPDGTFCPNATYCDGIEVCQAGACVAGTAVSCVDPKGEDVLSCSEAQQACAVVPNAPPVIAQDALAVAGLGLPYPYNAQGRVRAAGHKPMSFAACGGPTGFKVEPSTGEVTWVPQAVGQVQLCVSATNAWGSDSYTFSVDVQQPQGVGPTASFTVTPASGAAPLAAAFDGSGSSADASTQLVSYLWRFGDGTVRVDGPAPQHAYGSAGGYQAELTVTDGFGRKDSTKRPVKVLGPAGQNPPQARILSTALMGEGALLTTFRCDCQPGDAPITTWHWSLGGTTAFGEEASHTFGPGRFRVHLTVVDAQGLSATDSVEVVVTQGGKLPPECRLSVDPAAGGAPLTARYVGSWRDPFAQVVGHVLDFGDGLTSTEREVVRELPLPGRYPGTLTVTNEHGLTCVERVEAVVLGAAGVTPPRILSTGSGTASCGVDWQYGEAPPVSTGTRPLTWALRGVDGSPVPEGMTVDAQSGQVRWQPTSSQVGLARVVLRVENAAGADEQVLEVDVECGPPAQYAAACGCMSADGSLVPLALALVALVLGSRRRRRHRATPRGGC